MPKCTYTYYALISFNLLRTREYVLFRSVFLTDASVSGYHDRPWTLLPTRYLMFTCIVLLLLMSTKPHPVGSYEFLHSPAEFTPSSFCYKVLHTSIFLPPPSAIYFHTFLLLSTPPSFSFLQHSLLHFFTCSKCSPFPLHFHPHQRLVTSLYPLQRLCDYCSQYSMAWA